MTSLQWEAINWLQVACITGNKLYGYKVSNTLITLHADYPPNLFTTLLYGLMSYNCKRLHGLVWSGWSWRMIKTTTRLESTYTRPEWTYVSNVILKVRSLIFCIMISGTHRWKRRVPDLQMSIKDLALWQGIRITSALTPRRHIHVCGWDCDKTRHYCNKYTKNVAGRHLCKSHK